MKMKFSMFQERNGIWYVRIDRGKVRSLKTRDKKEAKETLEAFEIAYYENKIAALDKKKRINLDDFMIEYIKFRPDLSNSTTRQDKIALKSLGEVLGEKVALRTIDQKKIEEFKITLQKRGVQKTSINSYLRHIRAALNTAKDWGYISKKVPIKMLKTKKALPKPINLDDLNKILKYIKKQNFEIWRMCEFALWTACRREEVLNIYWQNIQDDVVKITGKGDKERLVPLLPRTIEALGEKKDIGLVFKKMHPDTLSHKFKEYTRACGFEDLPFHRIRHTSATQMLSKGVPIKTVSKILGHADLATTQIYADVLIEFMKEDLKKLDFD